MSTALARLVDEVKEANGWSDPDLVRNAHRRGYGLTKSNISRYRNEYPLVSIKGDVIAALAAALNVPVSRVAFAAVQSMGIEAAETASATPEHAIAVDHSLSERDRELLLTMMQAMRTR